MESFSKLQENNAHFPRFHIYLVSYLVLEGSGAQNSDDTQKKLPVCLHGLGYDVMQTYVLQA